MNQLDQWFFERTGSYPSIWCQAFLKEAFTKGWLIFLITNPPTPNKILFCRTNDKEKKVIVLPI